jgi:hypothetical protein
MVNVGKREDGLLDWANGIRSKLDMVKVRIEMYREEARTAGELAILNVLSALLEDDA